MSDGLVDDQRILRQDRVQLLDDPARGDDLARGRGLGLLVQHGAPLLMAGLPALGLRGARAGRDQPLTRSRSMASDGSISPATTRSAR